MMPQWVLDEIARRQSEAEKAYESVSDSTLLLGLSREEYCQRYVALFPPITWSSSTTGDL